MVTKKTSDPIDVSVDTAEIVAALRRIKPAVSKRSGSLPSLAGVRIEALKSGHVQLSTTDLDIQLSMEVEGNIKDNQYGTVLIPFAKIEKYAGLKKQGPLRISWQPNGTDNEAEAILGHGRSTLSLKVLELSEYPPVVAYQGRDIELNLEAIRDVFPAASTDETRPILCSVYVNDGEYAATDSYRLYVVESQAKTGDGFLIPVWACKELNKQKKVQTVAAKVSEKHLSVAFNDGFQVTTRLVEGQFPNYHSLLPSDTPAAFMFDDVDQMIAAVKTVGAMMPDAAVPVKLSASDEDGVFSVSGYQQDTGEITELVCGTAPTGKSEGVVVAFNPAFLQGLLTGTNAGYFAGVDSLKPWLLTEPAPAVGDAAVRHRLLMPVRVS